MRSLLVLCAFLSLGSPAFSRLFQSISDLKEKNYDFVIVGGGTAGSVLANRLSEDKKNRILVVEAGVDNANNQNLVVPFLGAQASNTIVDWNFTSTPQVGLLNRTVRLARGHVLGGSSSINFMAWSRGSNDLWDNFARLSQDSGWSWNSVSRYNLKASRLTPPADGHNTNGQVIPSAHGNGLVQTSVSGFTTDLEPLLVATAKSLGGRFKYNEDMNSGDMIGLGYVLSSIGNGERSSAATAYLKPAMARGNLDVVINSRATKLYASKYRGNGPPIIDTVEVASSENGPRVNLTTSKEVILSTGVFGTPQILLLSGIGPKDALSEQHIPVLQHSPDVGKHMAEHPLLATYFQIDSNTTTDPILRNQSLLVELFQQWETNRTGLLVDSGGGNAIAFLKNPRGFFGGYDPSSGPRSGNTEIAFNAGFVPLGSASLPSNGSYLTVVTAVISPTSRGAVTLKSANPFDSPLIDPQLYTTDYDIQSMVQVMKDAETFISQPSWRKMNVRPLAQFKNDKERETFARQNSVTVNHCVGTARMGPGGVEGGVVDSQLRVKGVKGLRVVDASVFPQIPESHPQAVVYILAERASDLIKSGY